MASAVLTIVGGVIGGPIGAAIGAVAGQAIDRQLFRPPGREGPRLSQLSVQTSAYGTPLPRLFGTMRVAGTVIWSTDLIESRSHSGGKGQPGVTRYSYSVSFAVALSARPILSVGRIWADGKLLRGAAGDFKTPTGFRLHLGGEDQLPDPLIAAAEGARAPAHRGLAYAVFEQFQLADYGNRIPSLTFEVVADAAPVGDAQIAQALSAGLVRGTDGFSLGGFSAYGDSARGVLAALAAAGGGWFAPDGAGLRLCHDAGPAPLIEDAGFAARERRPRGQREIAPLDSVPRTLTLAYYDPARDFQAGVQQARRPGAGNRAGRIDLAAALSAADAQALAEAALARAEAARERRQIALSPAALAIKPGDIVRIAGEPGRWRVADWSLEAMVLTLELVRLGRAAPSAGASAGRVLASPDAVPGRTLLHAAELPALDDVVLAAPRLVVAAAGTEPGWRRAALLVSTDGGARWEGAGEAATPAILGTLATVPRRAGSALIDRAGSVEVVLAHGAMPLADADAAALDAGANLALAGDELLQFGRAEPLGDNRWRLSTLLRGRRGTESAAGAQRAGDRFVLLAPGDMATVALPLAALGGPVALLASGAGDGDGPVRADVTLTGASLAPPAPVHLRVAADELRWARRSRAGWRWADGGDAPLAEERERYRLSVRDGDALLFTAETSEPRIDRALLPAGRVEVCQLGTFAASPPAVLTLDR
ncbi:phage tail protein [Sphingomonas sp.]|uniref:phage tail protein n=1 Tax=Sphingomonas sp. TaxID=28214 RepID=UPI001DB4879C|nr:phage tail protein [Sphingomonas sp.]MBX9796086.1 phage tail protein [Sphingomonas sp.]